MRPREELGGDAGRQTPPKPPASREKDWFFDAEPGALKCSCPCGCTNTNADASMFQDATVDFATNGAERGRVVCEPCFHGNWPEQCGKATYVSFEEVWERVQAEAERQREGM